MTTDSNGNGNKSNDGGKSNVSGNDSNDIDDKNNVRNVNNNVSTGLTTKSVCVRLVFCGR